MSVTASMLRRYSVEIGWAAFAAINFAVMPFAGEWETVAFHFVWVSLTIVYGFRVWRPWPTASVLGGVVLISGVALVAMADHGQVSTAELTEVPLMGAMFVAMVWHARRRQAALEELRRVTDRERDFVRDASHELRTPITIARGHAELIHAATLGGCCSSPPSSTLASCTARASTSTRSSPRRSGGGVRARREIGASKRARAARCPPTASVSRTRWTR